MFTDCNPVKFWFVSRHGTRLPTTSAINYLRELVDVNNIRKYAGVGQKCVFTFSFQLRDEVIDNYEKRRTKPDYGALCDEDLEILKNWHWNPNITGDYAEYLTTQVCVLFE